ncbi:MAG: flagellar assembly peptidoglycan hydrolase FlgJ [Proteobacteria bacterium]|nr:flagellar assembly peptidoglycan hydrolase FlgJ [Pseudomonadota bacterium]NOG58926.1 flagellar assembly peptidoglycan hydrolase FlgJ [Pseudomonadota bacterium]
METDLSSAKIYTEFSGLNKLKLAAKNSSPEALEEVANQFEAFFMKMMLKQMRSASLGESMFDSDQSRLYQDMMDQQLSLNLSEKRIFGIADSLVRQLKQSVNNEEGSGKLNPLPDRVNFEKTMLKLSTDIKLKDKNFETPKDFINEMRPYAEAAAEELGIPANILLAQSALETGWGNKVIQHGNGQSSHNLFGIKADQRWQGDYVNVSSLEYVDGKAKREFSNFKVYESYKQSFEDYVDFIKSNDRYQTVLKNNDSGETYIKALQDAGYATDPQYANKVINIVQREAI